MTDVGERPFITGALDTVGSQFRCVKGLKVRREVRADVGKYESLV